MKVVLISLDFVTSFLSSCVFLVIMFILFDFMFLSNACILIYYDAFQIFDEHSNVFSFVLLYIIDAVCCR